MRWLLAVNWQIIMTVNAIFAAEKHTDIAADMKCAGVVTERQMKIGTKHIKAEFAKMKGVNNVCTDKMPCVRGKRDVAMH